jgi:uncharacterized protein
MGRPEVLKTLKPELFANEKFGVITIQDIFSELEKPGRDPRPDFKVARFNEGVNDIKDLQEGLILQGTVSNVAAFGAFIDLGVHQDGLVHVSQLSHKFVSDAREVVKTGDSVTVQVLEVDVVRQRISLTMKLGEPTATHHRPLANRSDPRSDGAARHSRPRMGGQGAPGGQGGGYTSTPVVAGSAMASAFAKLQNLNK